MKSSKDLMTSKIPQEMLQLINRRMEECKRNRTMETPQQLLQHLKFSRYHAALILYNMTKDQQHYNEDFPPLPTAHASPIF